ncbi:MAG TPA: peptidoglycan DD-metalloendopeptidase family protein, partial [Sphingomicrobium sp.]|nr:peptidoglycan DD-metalloendopeptidase family protein [Sphingomicrobium sp.]
ADRLTKDADRQRDSAAKLRVRQEAAALAIAAAEAQISAADAEARLLSAKVAAQRDALRRQRAPASALLGGLAMMAQRPPLLALADRAGTDEFVRIRMLLDSTLPVIRQRTAALAGQIERGRRLEARLASARQGALARRGDLQARQREFAALEQQALRSAEQSGFAALDAGDVALSRGETGQALAHARQRGQSAARLAAQLAALGSPPERPFAPEGKPSRAIDYQLPANATVTDGFGSVSDSGIRSRGISMATRRGETLSAPASGTILFAGPYRSHDGIIIIAHGGGWMSLIVNAATDLPKGSRVRLGQPIGRSLGPIGVELSRNGQHLSPALIAGSSPTLSKQGKSR